MKRAGSVVVVACLLALAAGCAKDKDAKGKAGGAGKKVYSRDEFTAAVMGATVEDVRKLLGDPDAVEEPDDRPNEVEHFFMYRGRTRAAGGDVDRAVYAGYANGRIVRVTWGPFVTSEGRRRGY